MKASDDVHNHETWSAFYKNDQEANDALKKITTKLGENYLIVSAKIVFTTKFHDGNIYKIDIVKAKR
jgi:predicted transcriptional regulator